MILQIVLSSLRHLSSSLRVQSISLLHRWKLFHLFDLVPLSLFQDYLGGRWAEVWDGQTEERGLTKAVAFKMWV